VKTKKNLPYRELNALLLQLLSLVITYSQLMVPIFVNTWFVQKVSGLTTVHEVDKAYRVLSLIVFNIVPLRSYTLCPTFLPLLEIFCKLLFQDG